MTLGIFFTALGYATGAFVLIWSAHRRNLLTEGMAWIAGIGLFGGILGARLSEWVFEGWPFRLPPSAILDPENGGKALVGGVLIGWICADVAKRRMGIRRPTGDLFALALPAGEAVGRIGCYFNQCCCGCVTSGPIAVYQHGAWRHPAQLYSSFIAAAMFVVLFSLRNRMPKEGDLFKVYLVLYGVTRFCLEFVRERPSLVFGLSAMQWLCIELAVFGALALAYSARRARVVEAGL